MDSQTPTAAPEGRKSGKWMGIVVTLIVLLLLAGAAYVFMGSDKLTGNGLSGSVLASVNGTEITESDVDERISHAKTGLEAQGLNLSDPATSELLRSQALEEIINEMIVLADAEAKGITVTDAEVDAQYGQIRGRFETEELFTEELNKNSFTAETLRENVRRELIIQKYVAQIEGASTITITEPEINDFYAQLQGQSENLPPLTDLRVEIETQLRNQKLASAVQQVVEDLRSKADVQLKEEVKTEATTEAE